METFDSVESTLNFAIEREQESHDFYMDLAVKMKHAEMQKVFKQFAAEEMGHKEKLIKIKAGKLLVPAQKKVQDLKIGDYLVDVEQDDDLNYQQALIIAMKKEKAAFKLYSDLASLAMDQNLINTFEMLAQEEAKHKLRFEIEYDTVILKEN